MVSFASRSSSSSHCDLCDSCINCGGSGGDGDWVIQGQDIHHLEGHVSVGTSLKLAKFEINTPADDTDPLFHIRKDDMFPYMTVDQNGGVGLGVYGASYNLEVAGDAAFDLAIYHRGDANGDTYIGLDEDKFSLFTGDRELLRLDGTDDDDSVIVNPGGSSHVDFIVRAYGPTGPMNSIHVLGNGGRVGIGVDEPEGQLDVAGAIYMGSNLVYREPSASSYLRFLNHGAEIRGNGAVLFKAEKPGTEGTVTVNESGHNIDFQVRSQSDPEALWVDGQFGRVGVRTSSPQYALDVSGTARITGFRLENGASNGRVLTSDASGNGTWQDIPDGLEGSGTSGYLSRFTASNQLGNSVIYESGGNIGIGTSDPQAALHIAGPDASMQIVDDSLILEGAALRLDRDGGNQITIEADGVNATVNAEGADQFYVKMDSPYRFVIDDSCNVAIHGYEPLARLDVDGDLRLRHGVIWDNDSTKRIVFTNQYLDLRDTNEDTRLRVDADGNVGIWKLSPNSSYALHVGGDVLVEGIVYDNSKIARSSSAEPLGSALASLAGVNAVSYAVTRAEVEDKGLAADRHLSLDVKSLLDAVPEAARHLGDGVVGIEYSQLTPLLIEAIKELNLKTQRIDQLETELAELSELVERLLAVRGEQ
jgi:hypothetical protein